MRIVSDFSIDPVDLSKREAIFYLEPSYFDAMMLEIEERYGSLDTYPEDGLSLGPADRDKLRDLLTRATALAARSKSPVPYGDRVYPIAFGIDAIHLEDLRRAA